MPEEKIRDYLLSATHPIGRFKAAFFWSEIRSKRYYRGAEWQIDRD